MEYKEEAYRAFSRLVDSIYEDSLRAILRLPVEGIDAGSSGLSDEDDPFRPEGMVYSDSRSAPDDLCQVFGHGSLRNYAAMGSPSSAGFVRSKNDSMALAGIW